MTAVVQTLADTLGAKALIRQLAETTCVSAEIAEPAAPFGSTELPAPGQVLLARSRQWLSARSPGKRLARRTARVRSWKCEPVLPVIEKVTRLIAAIF